MKRKIVNAAETEIVIPSETAFGITKEEVIRMYSFMPEAEGTATKKTKRGKTRIISRGCLIKPSFIWHFMKKLDMDISSCSPKTQEAIRAGFAMLIMLAHENGYYRCLREADNDD